MERIFHLPNGDQLVCTAQAAIFRFSGRRRVLSTGAVGGGLRYDLTSAFNYCDCGAAGVCRPMEGKNLREHLRSAAYRLGLNPDYTTGLDTAANLDNMAVVTRRWGDLSVTAAISGGADVNALCAGDPASLTETDGEPRFAPPGTINIFLITDRTLSPGAMAELIVTATEAKTAVLRDLMQGSSVSPDLATGTGTDGIVVICGDSEDSGTLLNAGKHFKFGELAALAVRDAATQALFRQTGLCPGQQHTVLSRLRRFGITAETLLDQCRNPLQGAHAALPGALERMNRDAFLVGAVSLYLHLADQCRAGMLTAGEAEDWASLLLREIQGHYQCSLSVDQGGALIERLEHLLCALLLTNLQEHDRLYPS